MRRALLAILVLALGLVFTGCYQADESGKGPIGTARAQHQSEVEAKQDAKLKKAADEN